jgi:putative membrane protein
MFFLNKPKASLKEIVFKSIWFGFIAGMISGMVKIGWENIFPPRTIERNLINPPQHMAIQLGIPKKIVESYLYYSHDQKVFWFTLILHFSFAIVFAILYVFISQYYSMIGLWQGTVYGIVLWILWHIVLMPAFGTIPAPWDQPFSEHFSEFWGHIIWAWSISATVYYLISKDKKGNLKNI